MDEDRAQLPSEGGGGGGNGREHGNKFVVILKQKQQEIEHREIVLTRFSCIKSIASWAEDGDLPFSLNLNTGLGER